MLLQLNTVQNRLLCRWHQSLFTDYEIVGGSGVGGWVFSILLWQREEYI